MNGAKVSRATQVGIYLGKHWRLFLNEHGWKVLIFGAVISVLVSVVNSYATMYLLGAVTLLTEGRRIRCSRGKKIAYSFTFPFFVFSFGIAMLVAVFGNIEWKPIKHSVALSIGDMGSVSPQELRKLRKNRKL